jgi:hypothetical protein
MCVGWGVGGGGGLMGVNMFVCVCDREVVCLCVLI